MCETWALQVRGGGISRYKLSPLDVYQVANIIEYTSHMW